MTAPARDGQGHDALAALERLLRHKVISEEQAVKAARLIAGDPDLVFPPKAAERPPAPEPAPPAPAPAPEDNASSPGSEAP